MEEKTIMINRETAKRINYLLSHAPTSSKECFGEDDVFSCTAKFGGGYEVDVKLCGVRYDEFGMNLPWTEAVLFRDGAEVCCTEPSDGFFGEWKLHDGEKEFSVTVISEGEEGNDRR